MSRHRDNIHIHTLNASTIDDLRRALLDNQFDIVHFSGHGTRNGLVFEDTAGRIQVPPSEALAELLQRRLVNTVLLNACYSLAVGEFTSMGMSFTVATTGPISDPAAIEFTRGFYDSIGAGLDVKDAYEEGMSAAKLKALKLDTILLTKGQNYIASEQNQNNHLSANDESEVPRTLLGIAIDTSGSMEASIQNRASRDLSRFTSVQESLREIGLQAKNELQKNNEHTNDKFNAFVYAFGMRIGTGVADIASLWKASKNINIDREVEQHKQHLEAQGRSQLEANRGLIDLANRFGFGREVEAYKDAAIRSGRQKVIAEVGAKVLAEATRIGDTNMTAQELSEIFGAEQSGIDSQILEDIVYGVTPMVSAANEIQRRFQRTEPNTYDQRTLIVISDGSPTDGNPRDIFKEIESEGITIISCFVTDDDIADPRVLFGKPQVSWNEGAQLMWEIASEVEPSTPFSRYLLSQGWSIEKDAHLFVQVNHSEVLEEFLRFTGNYVQQSSVLLPRGR